MLDKIIHFSIYNKFIIGLFMLALIAVGGYSLNNLPIDALPDITNNQVQIITTSPTLATQEVEQFITYPIELAVKSIPKIVELRSVSRFGLSVVTIVFEENADIYWARAQISERLKEAESKIPKGLGNPELAPISTGLGEIYQYVVFPQKGFEKQYSATELRTIQDWIIRPQLIGTPGVAEVNTLGGSLKQYEIAIEPDKLKAMNTTIAEILDALELNNENTGGAYIDKKPYAYFIRGIGMVNGIDAINKIVIKTKNEIPILIRDVATVQIGSSVRYGAVTKDGKGEEVSGMVMMLKGENSAEVVSRVKEKMEQIKKSLPKGVSIEAFVDRTKLVNRAIGTVERNLLEGALIVVFVLILLIGNLRAGLIVASVIPLSLLFAVSMMHLFGVSGNLMSLGAIDFGLIVDGAVIIVESIIHRLQINVKGKLTSEEMDAEVYEASAKIRSSAAFGEIIILIVYLPILALVGIEGKMFGPMAQTVSFAILGAFILSLTYIPMMTALVLKKQTSHKINISDKIIHFIQQIYQPLLAKSLRFKGLVLSIAVIFLIISAFIFSSLGGEFIPTLDEGDIATNLVIASGSSLSQEIEATTKAEQILKAKFPEVKMIVTKIGSSEIPTDPMPMEVGDMIIILKDKKDWTSAKTKEELMEKMSEALEAIPGATTEFSQPIQMRFNELMTGVRSDVAVKIFGEDLEMLVSKGDEVLKIIQNIKGVTEAKAERVAGLPQITVRYNKDKLALYGLNVGDLNKVIRTGFAGEIAGVVYEGEKRFDMVVRLAQEKRQDISNLKTLFVSLPSGSQIPLEQVADIAYELGPMQISREDGKRRIVVGFNVRDRDVKSVIEEIQDKLDQKLSLPAGYYVTYGGQFQNLIQANERLAVAVPVALLLIFVLLFFTFRSVSQSLLIFSAIPFSAIGGIFALWIRNMPFSISAGVGFIALFGVAVLNGIVLIGYFNQLKAEGISDVMQRIKEGTSVRLRPVMMTAAVASLGFLPMALSTSAGAEVQKPLATVVIGGLISATLLTLIVLPILYWYLENNLKIKKSGIVTALMILLFIGFETKAQSISKLSLQQAIELGSKNNQLISAGELEIKMQSELRGTAFDIPKTNIGGMLGQYNTKAFDQNYEISQSFSPFQYGARKEVLTSNLKGSQIKLEQSKKEIIYAIRQTWMSLLYLTKLNTSLTKQDSLLGQFVKAASLRFQTGETNLLEKTTAITREQEIQQRIKQNESLIAVGKSKIRLLLNLNTDFSVSDTSFSALPISVLFDTTAINQNPVFLHALQQVEIARANRNLEKALLMPDFTAGYFIQSLTGNQDIDGKNINYNGVPRFQGFKAGIAIPIFSKSYRSKVQAAETNIQLQQKNVDYLQSQLQNQYQQQLTQLYTYQSLIEYYQTSAIPNAKTISTNASKSYQGGEISYVEYLQGIQTALDIDMNYLKAIADFNQSFVSLQYLLNQ
ncbi:CusA/CzcA family heavy metal efflux RND transporter [Dyadobacter subterraneus]|uniref:CusA/CzcA family heavy metal efflux RND transporter n=1 Tax=Dyadobacter subterraneus TaxID=2773304 RepID=A0ABR9WJA4_9BACT|nr:CusA/CzcA family heavy metal efflux RND transporter [Dyadobacter subterraneus]MBE9464971.1 CusA/CzcA family heavy metal efflux RND transporter [Dyadobacter subterraneus]